MTKHHVPFFLSDEFSKRIISPKEGKNPVQQKYKKNVASHENKGNKMTWWYIRWNSKVSSSLWADHLVTKGAKSDGNPKYLKNISVYWCENWWNILKRVLRNFKVEKSIYTTHCEIVEEAQEIYASWAIRS